MVKVSVRKSLLLIIQIPAFHQLARLWGLFGHKEGTENKKLVAKLSKMVHMNPGRVIKSPTSSLQQSSLKRSNGNYQPQKVILEGAFERSKG